MSAYHAGITLRRLFTTRKGCSKQLLRVSPNRCDVFRWQTSTSPKETPTGLRTPPRQISTLKLTIIGTSLGAASGTILSLYNNWKSKNSEFKHEQIPPKILDRLPDVKITKRFVNPNDQSGLELVLFQFQTCPFCCKVRAFLDYAGISYSVVEVDAVLRQDIKWSTTKKVPTVLVRQRDGRYVQMSDSSAIISLLASSLNDKAIDISELAQFYPTVSYNDERGREKSDVMNKYFLMYQNQTPKGLSADLQERERKWRSWADSHLVHLISPNCYQTLPEAIETFKWFSDAGEWNVHFPRWERNLMVYAGAGAMWLIAKVLKKRHGLSDDVRSHIYEALHKWNGELEKRKTPFMGGQAPNLADLSVFGVLSSMEGCQTFKDCLKNTQIGDWFYRVKNVVQQNRGTLVRERLDGHIRLEPAISAA